MNLKLLLSARVLFVSSAMAIAFLAPASVSGQNDKETFLGLADNLSGGPTPAVVDFAIERWSTDAERAQILAILKEQADGSQAQDRLLKALQKMPKVGQIRTTNTRRWDLRYARQSQLENGGRRIVLGTDRPIDFVDGSPTTGATAYPFTVVEIHLDMNDKGVGKISAGTKLSLDQQNDVVLEQYGEQPVRFSDIRRVK